jgi:hypothetical protein
MSSLQLAGTRFVIFKEEKMKFGSPDVEDVMQFFISKELSSLRDMENKFMNFSATLKTKLEASNGYLLVKFQQVDNKGCTTFTKPQ